MGYRLQAKTWVKGSVGIQFKGCTWAIIKCSSFNLPFELQADFVY